MVARLPERTPLCASSAVILSRKNHRRGNTRAGMDLAPACHGDLPWDFSRTFALKPMLVIAIGLNIIGIDAHQNVLRAQENTADTETLHDNNGNENDDAVSNSIFSRASLVGTYASTNIGRGGLSPVADVGIFTFDGNGGFSGVVDVNLPGASFLERNIFRSSFTGTYTVNLDGTGTTSTSFSLPDGSTCQTSSIFVISEFDPRSGIRIATEFTLIANDLSSTSGNLDVAVLKKI